MSTIYSITRLQSPVSSFQHRLRRIAHPTVPDSRGASADVGPKTSVDGPLLSLCRILGQSPQNRSVFIRRSRNCACQSTRGANLNLIAELGFVSAVPHHQGTYLQVRGFALASTPLEAVWTRSRGSVHPPHACTFLPLFCLPAPPN